MKLSVPGLIVALLAVCCQAQDINKQLAKYDKIEYESGYGEFYRSLFGACEGDELASLASCKNDSVATQSAWETVTRTVPEKAGREVYRPDKNMLYWFVGHFEGRNRISAPKWWRTIVLDARANRRRNIYPGEPKNRPYHRSKITGVACPINSSVIEKDKVVTYTSNKDSIVIPDKLFDRDDSGGLYCDISCVFTAQKCFVAIHGDVGYSHLVACIDRKTGDVDWKSEACGCWWGGSSGLSESWVSLVHTDDGRVFCFGSASIGFYAHAFDSSTGKTLLRFSNNY